MARQLGVVVLHKSMNATPFIEDIMLLALEKGKHPFAFPADAHHVEVWQFDAAPKMITPTFCPITGKVIE